MNKILIQAGWLLLLFSLTLLCIAMGLTSCGSTWNVEGNNVLLVIQETDSTITVKKDDKILTLEKNDTITKKNKTREIR